MDRSATADDLGELHLDLHRLLGRRRALRLLGGLGLAGVLAACGSSDDGATGGATTTAPGATTTGGSTQLSASAGAAIPQETQGPYPADGSNGLPGAAVYLGHCTADGRYSVYEDSRYGGSERNLARLSLETDNVFADGWSDQLATVSGSADEGYEVSLLVRV